MSPDDWGETLLHQFSRIWNVKLVQAILEKGVDVDTRTRELSTPLHCALSGGGGAHIVQFLVNAGADVQAEDNRMRSVLCVAVCSASCDVVSLIINAVILLSARRNTAADVLYQQTRVGSPITLSMPPVDTRNSCLCSMTDIYM